MILNSAPRHATRLQLESASKRAQDFAEATAKEHRAEAFEAADDLLRALRRFQALPTNRLQEMRDFLSDTSGRALDQLSNVEGYIERELDAQGASLAEPLDLSELRAFWESVK
jgi:hypothetical protein